MSDFSTAKQPAEQFANYLLKLHDRVQRMEQLLVGAETVLSVVRYEGHLSYTPAEGEYKEEHRRSYMLIEFLGEQLEEWKNAQAELEAVSDDIWHLKEKAKEGNLIRYGKYQAEPVA
jgi:hypothetical protein